MATTKQQQEGTEDIPPEVLAESERIRGEGEGSGEEQPPEQATERVKLSRREQKRQEELAEIAAAKEAATAAQRAAEELRAQREEDRQRMARMEALLQGQVESRRTTTSDDKDDEEEKRDRDLPGWYRKQIRKAEESLTEGKISEYHERMGKAQMRLAQEQSSRAVKQLPTPAQQPMQKPAWVSAVESQFPDVLTHPNGIAAVGAFLSLDPAPNKGPDQLRKAFTRAQEELGLKKPDDNDRRRQMLSGGPVNGQGRTPPPKKGERFVSLPQNYKEIARRAGMTPEAYAQAYAAMNPGEVSSE